MDTERTWIWIVCLRVCRQMKRKVQDKVKWEQKKGQLKSVPPCGCYGSTWRALQGTHWTPLRIVTSKSIGVFVHWLTSVWWPPQEILHPWPFWAAPVRMPNALPWHWRSLELQDERCETCHWGESCEVKPPTDLCYQTGPTRWISLQIRTLKSELAWKFPEGNRQGKQEDWKQEGKQTGSGVDTFEAEKLDSVTFHICDSIHNVK